MSDRQSSPPEPLGYFVPGQMPKQRPASVTVVSVLAILFGTYSILDLQILFVRSWFAILSNNLGFGLPMFYFLDRFVSGVLGVVLLVGGILALLLKSSGRRLLIYYSILHVLFGLAAQVMIFAFLLPILAQPPPVAMPTTRMTKVVMHAYMINFRSAMRNGWLSIIPSVAAICVWSIVIMYVMTRPSAKTAFAPTKGERCHSSHQMILSLAGRGFPLRSAGNNGSRKRRSGPERLERFRCWRAGRFCLPRIGMRLDCRRRCRSPWYGGLHPSFTLGCRISSEDFAAAFAG